MNYFDSIVKKIKEYLYKTWNNIVLTENSIVDDVVVRAPATEMARVSALLDYYKYTQSLDGFLKIIHDSEYQESLKELFGYTSMDEVKERISADLDELVANFQVPARKQGKKAQTTISLVFGVGDRVVCAAGSRFFVPSTTSVYFELEDSINEAPSLRTDGTYILKASVIAEEVGTIYNVPANTITESQSGLPSLIYVTNEQAANGGEEVESDEALIARAKLWLTGFALDSKDGITKYVLDNGASAVSVVTYNDDKSIRKAGVDVWVRAYKPALDVQDFVYDATTSTRGFKPRYQPLLDDTTNFVLSGYTDVRMVVDKQSAKTENGYSKDASDYVRFIFSSTPPALGTTLSLTYQYNKAVTEFQSLFLPPNPELFTDVKVKEAIRVQCGVSVKVKIASTEDINTKYDEITTVILSVFDSLNLGEHLDNSDLVVAVGNVAGVDSVTIDRFNYVGQSGVAETLVSNYNEYLFLLQKNLSLQVEQA